MPTKESDDSKSIHVNNLKVPRQVPHLSLARTPETSQTPEIPEYPKNPEYPKEPQKPKSSLELLNGVFVDTSITDHCARWPQTRPLTTPPKKSLYHFIFTLVSRAFSFKWCLVLKSQVDAAQCSV